MINTLFSLVAAEVVILLSATSDDEVEIMVTLSVQWNMVS